MKKKILTLHYIRINKSIQAEINWYINQKLFFILFQDLFRYFKTVSTKTDITIFDS